MSTANAHYRFRTVWTLEQPLESVWSALEQPTAWPRWWPGCMIVEPLATGRWGHSGSCYRFHWEGALPYRLVLNTCVTESDYGKRMFGTVEGPVVGTADWTLWRGDGGVTCVAFDFAVSGRQPWTRYLAPLSRPVFRWNHERLMARGEDGLRRWLSGRRHSRTGRLHTGFG